MNDEEIQLMLEELKRLKSGKPYHAHTCVSSKGVHQWFCSSPYCDGLERTCTLHGGELPRA